MSTDKGGYVEASLTWVERVQTVDAIDPVVEAIQQNPGWRLLHVGTGAGGQTTLTYGWPWPEPTYPDPSPIAARKEADRG